GVRERARLRLGISLRARVRERLGEDGHTRDSDPTLTLSPSLNLIPNLNLALSLTLRLFRLREIRCAPALFRCPGVQCPSLAAFPPGGQSCSAQPSLASASPYSCPLSPAQSPGRSSAGPTATASPRKARSPPTGPPIRTSSGRPSCPVT